jgi:uncharacterized membrane protein
VLWPNLNLPFWLSLFPFVTAWMGHFGHWRVADSPLAWPVYVAVALMWFVPGRRFEAA